MAAAVPAAYGREPDRGIAAVTAVDRKVPAAGAAPDSAGRADPRPAAGRSPLGWLAPLLALGAGAGAVVAPLPTILVLAAALLLALALLTPRLTAGIAVLAILFARPLEHLIPIPGCPMWTKHRWCSVC